MKARVRLLRTLLEDGMYPIDELVIADAILARQLTRMYVPEVTFANDRAHIRSFRHDPTARSFRLARPAGRRAIH
jgi:hypothetical protein